MNFGSLTRDFLLVKTSFPMGFAVGINFENFTQRKILAALFSYKIEVWLVVCFALNSWRRESVKHERFESHPGFGNRDEIIVSFPETENI